MGTVRIQPNVIGVALGKDKSLVAAIHPGQNAITGTLPGEPVWVKLARNILKNPVTLPTALQIFAISLQSSDSVIVALGPAPAGSADAFEIKLDAQCQSPVTADTIRKQLDIDTKTLTLELAHEHEQPNPADLTGLLTTGKFDVNGKNVIGEWPVRKELLKTLQQ